MSYEYTGTIEVTGVPSDEDVIAKAIDYVIKDEEWDEESIELTRDVNRTKHSMDYEGGGDYNEMDGYYNLFYSVGETIIEMYPDCSMIAHFCGTNMVAGTETVYTVHLQNRHVRKIDFEFTDEFVHCPECDEEVATLGEIWFGRDYEYECPDCGKKMTEEDIIDAIGDQISEYDV